MIVLRPTADNARCILKSLMLVVRRVLVILSTTKPALALLPEQAIRFLFGQKQQEHPQISGSIPSKLLPLILDTLLKILHSHLIGLIIQVHLPQALQMLALIFFS